MEVRSRRAARGACLYFFPGVLVFLALELLRNVASDQRVPSACERMHPFLMLRNLFRKCPRLPLVPYVQRRAIAPSHRGANRRFYAQRLDFYAYSLQHEWNLCIRDLSFLESLQKSQEAHQLQEFKALKRAVGSQAFFPLDLRDIGAATWGLPLMSKTRPVLDKEYVIMPFQTRMHWGKISDVDHCDIAFERKRPVLVWRGRISGNPQKPYGAHRHKLLAKFFGYNSSLIDIGPSKVDYNDVTRSFLFNHVSKSRLEAFASKNALRPCTWIQYRYVLSVEGNDVSTALKWMLFSLSVVFMPLPTVGSWAAEPLMTPWQEYIPISHTFDDLISKVEYCNGEGFELCRSVALHGRKFAKSFFDRNQEITLVNDIMTRYERQVRFFFTPKSMEHGKRLRLLSGREDNIVKLENSTCPPMGLVV